ncbi:MAG: DMT family transporter [Acidobacteriota bacterium]|nr:DMT family transporter [Acidobacteriota bacterium]
MTGPVLIWLLLAIIWGSTWMVIKLGVNELPPFSFAAGRFVMASLAMYLLLKLRGGRLYFAGARQARLSIVSGFLIFGVNYALVYWAETRIDSSMAAVLYTSLPLFSAVLAHYYLPGDRITWQKVIGIGIGLTGVILLFRDQLALKQADLLWGSLAILFASFLCAVGSLLVKKQTGEFEPLSLTTSQLLVGTIPLVILGLIIEGNPLSYSWRSAHVFGAAYLGLIGTGLTFGLLNWLFSHMSYSRIQLLPLASTTIAVWLGWLILDEKLSAWELAGTGMVLLGLVQATRSQ